MAYTGIRVPGKLMIIYGISSQKQFDNLWAGYKRGFIEIIQSEFDVGFLKGDHTIWMIDLDKFYDFYSKENHGPNPIIWEKPR